MSPFQVPTALHTVAVSAARGFLGDSARLEPLAHGQSLTIRVEALSGRYLLRVHVPRLSGSFPFASVPQLESECEWLLALDGDTELVAQRPIPSPEGGFVLCVPRADGSAAACTLLRWVEGEHVRERLSPEQAGRIGELVATLHAHAQGWERPANFERGIHDRSWTRTALARVLRFVEPGLLAAEDAGRLTRAVDQLDAELSPLASDPDHVGLIHADLHEENYVFHEGRPRPIDFGLCGFGPWLYDLAECCMHLMPDRRRDLVDAYARERPLDDGDLRRLEGYVLAAAIETNGYHASDPSQHASLAKNLTGLAQKHVRRYLDGRSYIFDV